MQSHQSEEKSSLKDSLSNVVMQSQSPQELLQNIYSIYDRYTDIQEVKILASLPQTIQNNIEYFRRKLRPESTEGYSVLWVLWKSKKYLLDKFSHIKEEIKQYLAKTKSTLSSDSESGLEGYLADWQKIEKEIEAQYESICVQSSQVLPKVNTDEKEVFSYILLDKKSYFQFDESLNALVKRNPNNIKLAWQWNVRMEGRLKHKNKKETWKNIKDCTRGCEEYYPVIFKIRKRIDSSKLEMSDIVHVYPGSIQAEMLDRILETRNFKEFEDSIQIAFLECFVIKSTSLPEQVREKTRVLCDEIKQALDKKKGKETQWNSSQYITGQEPTLESLQQWLEKIHEGLNLIKKEAHVCLAQKETLNSSQAEELTKYIVNLDEYEKTMYYRYYSLIETVLPESVLSTAIACYRSNQNNLIRHSVFDLMRDILIFSSGIPKEKALSFIADGKKYVDMTFFKQAVESPPTIESSKAIEFKIER